MYNNKMFNQSGNAIRDGGSIAFTGTSYKHITVSVETIDILNNINIYKDESGAVSGVRCPVSEFRCWKDIWTFGTFRHFRFLGYF